ncbi:MAG TPA: protein TolQ [Rhizomicrobium sp.]|jgi:biopolymer transport protein TolQ|nr:protein TolQ [Rhizomicrobium sp.]
MLFKRVAIAAFSSFLIVAVAGPAPALAQSHPRAAPTTTTPESQPLPAPTTSVDITQTGGQITPTADAGNISIVSLFLRADLLVKAVFLLLLAASLWSWTIIIGKWMTMGTLRRRADRFEKIFWSGLSLDELYAQFAQRPDNPMTAVFISGLREWRRAFESGAPKESQLSSIRDRIDKAMTVSITRETDGIEHHLGFLATVGATAPFVGLFGTVWGIMNSFSAIAARHDTTLAVVAPGIAEALFATAMGLLAAIPAVIFYNRFVNQIGRYSTRLETFADEFSTILSRQLDEKAR